MNKFVDYFYALAATVFGFVTLFFLSDNGEFASVYSLKVLEIISTSMPYVIAVVACVGAVLIVLTKTKIAGFFISAAVTGCIAITSIISLFTVHTPHSPTLFFFVIVPIAYAARAFAYVNEKYNPKEPHENRQGTSQT